MAGFHKTVVLAALMDELERAQHTTARKHDEALAQFNAREQRIREARSRVTRVLKGLQALDAKQSRAILNLISPTRQHSSYRDDQFVQDVKDLDSYDMHASNAAPPQLVRTRQERMLEHVVKIVESYDGESITQQTLRDLGVLEFVKVPKDAC